MTTTTRTTDEDTQGMSGRRPISELTRDSLALGRRIMLDKVPLLSDDDLKIFRFELFEASAQMRSDLETAEKAGREDDWIRRTRHAERFVRVFIVACGEEKELRILAARKEANSLSPEKQAAKQAAREAMWQQQIAAERKRKRKVRKHILRMEWEVEVMNRSLEKLWGVEEASAFRTRAQVIAEILSELAVPRASS